MKNLRISRKLLLAFSLLVIGVAAMGGFVLSAMDGIDTATAAPARPTTRRPA